MKNDQINTPFLTKEGTPVPGLTAEQMLKVDRIAMEEFHIHLLQMMENAGRNLADCAIDMLREKDSSEKGSIETPVLVLAGSGGNGGGGLCCARHLSNRGFPVAVVLDHPAEKIGGAAARQLSILMETGVPIRSADRAAVMLGSASLVIDTLIGYSLKGAPRGVAENLITQCSRIKTPILSLDVPSGVNATDGRHPGAYIEPTRTMTLALPKLGLVSARGDLYLADIGIPAAVFSRIGVVVPQLFEGSSWIPISVTPSTRR